MSVADLQRRIGDLEQRLDELLRHAVPQPVREPPPLLPGLEIRQFRILDVYDDCYLCRAYDGAVVSGDTIYVAKPYLLRATPFDGQTVNGYYYEYAAFAGGTERTVTLPNDDYEMQVVVPYPYADDIIYAAKGIEGGTSVQVTGDDLDWLDLNVDGRYWAKKGI